MDRWHVSKADALCPRRLSGTASGGAATSRLTVLASLLASLAAGCAVPVAGGLDEGEANRVFVALDHAQVDPDKEQDPSAEGKWRISVARDDVPRALEVLREEALPRPTAPGVLDAIGKGSLVPSETAERAQLMAGVAGELQRSLETIDGVLSARVHLSLPPAVSPRDAPPVRATASVLLEHRGATPPISADAVQRLVAGGVAGLMPTDVAVVLVAHSAAAAASAEDYAHVGPIAVARPSVRRLQAALAALMALVAGLAAAASFLYVRLARAQAALAREASSPARVSRGPGE